MADSNVFKLRLVSYNCKHFIQDGYKFDFMNDFSKCYDFILMQEHWLYPSQLGYLAKIGNGFCIEAKSAMDEIRQGRPFGGCAIPVYTVKWGNFGHFLTCLVIFLKKIFLELDLS